MELGSEQKVVASGMFAVGEVLQWFTSLRISRVVSMEVSKILYLLQVSIGVMG